MKKNYVVYWMSRRDANNYYGGSNDYIIHEEIVSAENANRAIGIVSEMFPSAVINKSMVKLVEEA